MNATTAILLIAAIAGLAVVYVIAPVMLYAYRKLHGRRLVICPETRAAAAVEVDAGHAALSALGGTTDLRLSSCSRWPERADCGQECIRQIAEAPDGCLIRTVLTRWYEGKSCVLCGHEIGPVPALGNKPALLAPDGKTVEWDAVWNEELPQVLKSHRPVCWNCHIAETFRRHHPRTFLDQPPPSEIPRYHH
jgi:hypothetical protein